jgi:hypothetical protein
MCESLRTRPVILALQTAEQHAPAEKHLSAVVDEGSPLEIGDGLFIVTLEVEELPQRRCRPQIGWVVAKALSEQCLCHVIAAIAPGIRRSYAKLSSCSLRTLTLRDDGCSFRVEQRSEVDLSLLARKCGDPLQSPDCRIVATDGRRGQVFGCVVSEVFGCLLTERRDSATPRPGGEDRGDQLIERATLRFCALAE